MRTARIHPFPLPIVYAIAVVLFLVVIPWLLLSLGLFIDRTAGVPHLQMDNARYALGGAIAIVGLFLMLWTNVALVRIGGGHPQEAFGRELLPASVHLVTVGPFARTRNPMMLGLLVLLEGLAIAIGSVATALLVVPAFTVLAVLYLRHWEEPRLLVRFGAQYEQYRREVPMLLPIGHRSQNRCGNRGDPES